MPPTSWRKFTKQVVAQTALEIRAGINAGRAMALEIDEVAAMRLVAGMPKMHETGVIKRRRRLEACNVSAKLGRFLVRLDHHRRGVPADVAADVLLELAVARMGRLGFGRNRVDVSGIGGERQLRALTTSGGDNRIQNVVDLGDSLEGFDGIERVEPFVGFVGLVLDPVIHRGRPPYHLYKSRKRAGAVFSCVRAIGNCDGRRCCHVNHACKREAHWRALVRRDRMAMARSAGGRLKR